MKSKQTTFVWGCGSAALQYLPQIEEEYEILGFVSNNKKRWNTEFQDKKVYSPLELPKLEFDFVIIASNMGLDIIQEQLEKMGISRGKIIRSFVEVQVKARIKYLENLASEFNERKIEGSVAEGGVFQGEFAKEINGFFPDKKIYLFDTFTGFSERDTKKDNDKNYSSYGENHYDASQYSIISPEEIVLSKLPYPQNAMIKKGFFPESAVDIDDKFCFVNLDFDLYEPILAGLNFFYPKMVQGGVILIHDYFNKNFNGVKPAVQ